MGVFVDTPLGAGSPATLVLFCWLFRPALPNMRAACVPSPPTATQVSQQVVAGLWDKDPPLMQLPHVTRELAQKCAAAGVSGARRLVPHTCALLSVACAPGQISSCLRPPLARLLSVHACMLHLRLACARLHAVGLWQHTCLLPPSQRLLRLQLWA